jgi:hypothetical protein
MNDLELRNQQEVANWMEPKAFVARLNRVKQIMKEVMKENVHFGIIPGCNQRSLYQSGQQVLCVGFCLGTDPENIEEFKEADEIRYKVKTRLFDQKTGATITYGVGECSSSEDKYMWRKPKKDEFENTSDDRRRIKYTNDGQVKQVRTNPADMANTVLRMATKRADVHCTIKGLAASEIFTSEIEDLVDVMDIDNGGKKSSKPQVNPDDVKTDRKDHPQGLTVLIGIVQDVKSKTGVGKNKDGTMFFIKINNSDLSTFDLTIGAAATALKGKKAEYTTEVNGKYTNIMSIRAAAAEFGFTEAKIAGMLDVELGCTIDTVPAEQQQQVLDHIRDMK